MNIKEWARAHATRYYMIHRQRERVCEAAKEYVNHMCCETFLKFEKEVRKLRALEGE